VPRGYYRLDEPVGPALGHVDGERGGDAECEIAILRAEGLIRVEHGIGAFVQEIPTVKRVRRVPRGGSTGSSFAEEMRNAPPDATCETEDSRPRAALRPDLGSCHLPCEPQDYL
jgi:hypothetical protein